MSERWQYCRRTLRAVNKQQGSEKEQQCSSRVTLVFCAQNTPGFPGDSKGERILSGEEVGSWCSVHGDFRASKSWHINFLSLAPVCRMLYAFIPQGLPYYSVTEKPQTFLFKAWLAFYFSHSCRAQGRIWRQQLVEVTGTLETFNSRFKFWVVTDQLEIIGKTALLHWTSLFLSLHILLR